MFTFPVMHFSGGIPVEYLVVAGGGGGEAVKRKHKECVWYMIKKCMMYEQRFSLL